MQKSYPPEAGMPSYHHGFYPPENGFKYENGYGGVGGGGGGGGGHYGTPAPENVGLYYAGNCGVVGLQNQATTLGGPVPDGCPPSMAADHYGPDPGNPGHYGGMGGGGPCGQNTSLNCPPGMGGLHGVGLPSGKQQTEIYPWMKESRQNNKRQNVTGKTS